MRRMLEKAKTSRRQMMSKETAEIKKRVDKIYQTCLNEDMIEEFVEFKEYLAQIKKNPKWLIKIIDERIKELMEGLKSYRIKYGCKND